MGSWIMVLRLNSDGGGSMALRGLGRFAAGARTVSAHGWSRLVLCVGALALGAPPVLVSSEAFAQATDVLEAHGSDVLAQDLLPGLIRGYAETLPGGTADLDSGADDPTTTAFVLRANGQEAGRTIMRIRRPEIALQTLQDRKATMALLARRVTDPESRNFEGATGIALRSIGSEHPVAHQGIAIVVHPEKRDTKLTLEQVRRVFAGLVQNWRDVEPGGVAAPLSVHVLSDEASATRIVQDALLAPAGLRLSNGALRHATVGSLIDAVAKDRLAIGFVPAGEAAALQSVTITSSCPLQYEPKTFDIKTAVYPLSQAFYIYTAGPPRMRLAADLLQFVSTEAGVRAVKGVNLIDTKIAVQPEAERRAWVKRALDASNGAPPRPPKIARDNFETLASAAERTSLVVQFGRGSAEITPDMRPSIERLANFLRSPAIRTTSWLLLGFSEPSGDWEQDLALSTQRAIAVGSTLKGEGLQGVSETRVAALGSLGLVRCPQEAADRSANDRVELWLIPGR